MLQALQLGQQGAIAHAKVEHVQGHRIIGAATRAELMQALRQHMQYGVILAPNNPAMRVIALRYRIVNTRQARGGQPQSDVVHICPLKLSESLLA
jgi:hypothetical protein